MFEDTNFYLEWTSLDELSNKKGKQLTEVMESNSLILLNITASKYAPAYKYICEHIRQKRYRSLSNLITS